MSSKNDFQIPKLARPGEVWFFVDLSILTSHTPDQVIDLAQKMGYSPQLRYMEVFIEGVKHLNVALLLHHQQLDPSTMPEDLEDAVGEKLVSDWEELTSTLQPDLAVRLRRGTVPNPVAV
jgi:hypothetical protein